MMDLLQKYLDSVRETPFKWGVHDCCLFPAKAMDAMYGTAYSGRVSEFRCDTALRYRRALRGTTLEAMVRRVLGDPIGGEPMRGDVVLVEAGNVQTLGIATPPVALVVAETGFAPVPLSAVRATWRHG